MHRLMTDVGASIVASAAMVALMLGGGQLLTGGIVPSTSTDDESRPRMTCLERPLVPVGSTRVRSVTQLCLTDGGIQPRVELADGTPGFVYTTWLAVHDRPAAWLDGPCAGTRLASITEMTTPGRLGGAVADQDGRVVLSHPLPGVRLDATTGVELLVVEHARSGLHGGEARAGQLLAWSTAWSRPTGQVADRRGSQGQLIGCAVFWIRGGVEQSDH
jgi:hypothetical protein